MDITGTSGDDFLDDTTGDDRIDAGAGDDGVRVTNGHDQVDGGSGDDYLIVRWWEENAAIVNAVPLAGFTFRLVGGSTRSLDMRGVEDLEIFAGNGDDNFVSGDGDDKIADGRVFFEEDPPTGNDIIGGGGGDDYITVYNGHDAITGGDGRDTINIVWALSTVAVTNAVAPTGWDTRFESGAGRSVNLTGFERISIVATRMGDNFTTFGGDDLIQDGPSGSFDDDVLGTGAGDDRISVNSGHDIVDGGPGSDTLDVDWDAATSPIIMGVAPQGSDIRFQSGTNRSVNAVGFENFSITGGYGNDDVTTLGGNDSFFDRLLGTSDDIFNAGAGDDLFRMQSGHDRGDGGAGNDDAIVDWGQFAGASRIVMGATPTGFDIRFEVGTAGSATLVNFERITLYAGSGNDDVTLLDGDDLVRGNGGNDRVDGRGGNDSLYGDAGDDELHGGDGDDDLEAGSGVDSMFGEGGNDFGRLTDDGDSFDGGAGIDTALIAGNYASFTARISADTEVLLLASGSDSRFGPGNTSFDYNVIIPDTSVGIGRILTIQAADLLAGEDLRLDGSAELGGHFRMFVGRGNDDLIGGAGSDGFLFGADGNLAGADRINGGAGTDTIALRGNYVGATAVAFGEASFANVEVLAFLSGLNKPFGGLIVPEGFDYSVTMANGNVAAGARLDVIGTALAANESLAFDGRAELDGSFRIISGAGNDTLFGSQNGDILAGQLGADAMDGSGGADLYVYRFVEESTAAATDSLALGEGDRIDLAFIDANGNAGDGNQAFSFIGEAAFGGVAGQLRAVQASGGWTVEADVDGDGVADFVVNVATQLTITADAFIL